LENTKTLLIDLGVGRNPERFSYDRTILSVEVKKRTGTAYLSFSEDGFKFNLDLYEKISCPTKEFFIYNKKQNGLLILKLTFGTSLKERIKEILKKSKREDKLSETKEKIPIFPQEFYVGDWVLLKLDNGQEYIGKIVKYDNNWIKIENRLGRSTAWVNLFKIVFIHHSCEGVANTDPRADKDYFDELWKYR